MQKNIAVYYIYRMIENESDPEHKLTQKQIAERLANEYDIVLERKAISRTIDELIKADDNIRKSRRGVYMEQRTFASCELFFLLDSVYYNKQLPQKHAREMIDKLISLGSVSFREQSKDQYKEDVVSRPNKSNLLLYLEIVNEAIRDEVKIQVFFGKESVLVSPLAMALDHGQYWLVTAARDESKKTTELFPIALIDDVKMTDEKTSIQEDDRIRDLRLALCHQGAWLLAPCNMVKVGIMVKNIWLKKFEETFGQEYLVEYKSKQYFIAQVYCGEKKIINWCIENSAYCYLVYPESIQKKLIRKLQNSLRRYGNA